MIYATGALVDVVVAVSMCWYLARMRKMSVKRTQSLIDQLVTWCIRELFMATPFASCSLLLFLIESGLLTSIGSIAALVAVGPNDSTSLIVLLYRHIDSS